MKILLVSWYFPPVNTIGSLRVGALARFLIERGHDIGVVSGKDWGHPETLPLQIPLEKLIYAKSIDLNDFPEFVQTTLSRALGRGGGAASDGERNATAAATAAPAANPSSGSLLRRLYALYGFAVNIPDNRIGWLPWAYPACLKLCRSWKPDVIFATGPLFTALVTARLASARLGIPWVAELRDRWADDPYDEVPAWRARINQCLERRILTSAAGLVTVTEPWSVFYRGKYGKPVLTAYNGYDPADFMETDDPRPASDKITIGYAGSIYPGRRDPTPLFEALQRMGPAAESFRVAFCGTDPAHVMPLAERAGVRHLVEIRPAVPYKQSLEFQRQSDVLLLMQWDDPREQGNCPGKFFEYLASLRPVLLLGLADGVPATILRERAAGFCSTDPAKIAVQLNLWLDEKKSFGRVRPLPLAAREGLSRNIQFEHLETFLAEMAKRPQAR